MTAMGGSDKLLAVHSVADTFVGTRAMVEQSERPTGPYFVDHLRTTESADLDAAPRSRGQRRFRLCRAGLVADADQAVRERRSGRPRHRGRLRRQDLELRGRLAGAIRARAHDLRTGTRPLYRRSRRRPSRASRRNAARLAVPRRRLYRRRSALQTDRQRAHATCRGRSSGRAPIPTTSSTTRGATSRRR